jgi:hypothetical protein
MAPMRLLLAALLLAPPALAEPLVAVARLAPEGGRRVWIAAAAGGRVAWVRAGDGAFVVQSAGGDGRPETALAARGDALGLCWGEAPAVLVRRPGGAALLRPGARRGETVEWSVALPGAGALALLALAAGDGGHEFAAADGAGLYVGGWSAEGRERSEFVGRPGKAFVAATEAFRDHDGDGRAELFVLAQPLSVLRIARAARGYDVLQDYTVRADADFVPRALAAGKGQLWIGGTRAGEARLLRLDPDAPPAVHKFRDVFADPASGRRDPEATFAPWKGSVECLALLDDRAVVAGGTREGRGYVAVVERERGAVRHDVILDGGAVRGLALNPARAGWSVAALAEDGTIHLLRVPGDPERPAAPAPPPPPAEDVLAGREDPAVAVFPRIEFQRGGPDTLLYALNLGAREVQLSFRFVDADGRLVAESAGRLAAGRRAKLAVSSIVRGNAFDGYLLVEGGRRATLVLEAVSGAIVTQPHWR